MKKTQDGWDVDLEDKQLLTYGISYSNASSSCISDSQDVEIEAKDKANDNIAKTDRENAICRSTSQS